MLKLVRELDPPGRFLRKNGVGTFVQVTGREAQEKVCQTLRDAVSEANTSRSSNAIRKVNQSDLEDEGDDEDDDDENSPSKMPLLPIKEEQIKDRIEYYPHAIEEKAIDTRLAEDQTEYPIPIKEEPIDDLHFEHEHDFLSSEILPLKAETSSSTISPDRVTSSRFDAPATVTPSNQTTGDASLLHVVTSSNQIDETSPSWMLSDSEMGYDAYNYLSRVGIHDDFDLFNGELLKTAEHDEVFTSMGF